jgi:hypothetical protein
MLAIATIAFTARYVPVTNRVVLGVAALAPYLMLGVPVSVLLFALDHDWILTAVAAALTLATIAIPNAVVHEVRLQAACPSG